MKRTRIVLPFKRLLPFTRQPRRVIRLNTDAFVLPFERQQLVLPLLIALVAATIALGFAFVFRRPVAWESNIDAGDFGRAIDESLDEAEEEVPE